jgi:hypothetical protein
MYHYAVTKGFVRQEDVGTFQEITSVIGMLPDFKFQVSCHMICLALARCFLTRVQHGYFLVGGIRYQHSWLRMELSDAIIDAYPVAGCSPFIVSGDPNSPWPQLYRESDDFRTIFESLEFMIGLKNVEEAIEKVINGAPSRRRRKTTLADVTLIREKLLPLHQDGGWEKYEKERERIAIELGLSHGQVGTIILHLRNGRYKNP